MSSLLRRRGRARKDRYADPVYYYVCVAISDYFETLRDAQMKIDLSGKMAVITGGSRGLGEAMAKSLSEAGAQVALVARDVQRLEAVRDAITAKRRDSSDLRWRRDV